MLASDPASAGLRTLRTLIQRSFGSPRIAGCQRSAGTLSQFSILSVS
jgi:hypothetical protein